MTKKGKKRDREESLSDDASAEFDEINIIEHSKKKEQAPEESVYAFDDSDDTDDDDDNLEKQRDENSDFDMGSDIEEEEDALPDQRAWGTRSRRFYNTDFVDQDYEGFYEGKVAEEAELEEQEARRIQKRLAEQLSEEDFKIPEIANDHTESDLNACEAIETDVSKLSCRQKLDLLKKESPEFFFLIQDFKSKLVEIEQKLLPILNYFKNEQEPGELIKFLHKKFLLYMNYCTNISFYLLLKAKRVSIANHPILKSLYRYRKLMEQMHDLDEDMDGKVENLLKTIANNQEVKLDSELYQVQKKEKTILKLLSEEKNKRLTKSENKLCEIITDKQEMSSNVASSDDDKCDEPMENDECEDLNEEPSKKRAITYEMAKNKGLMPKRNKVQRNPRVKHRQKYRKALIRRRGQVRTAKSEIAVYGGEPTGIKSNVVKSIKLK